MIHFSLNNLIIGSYIRKKVKVLPKNFVYLKTIFFFIDYLINSFYSFDLKYFFALYRNDQEKSLIFAKYFILVLCNT